MSAEPFKLKCPQCGRQLRLPDRTLIGKSVRCPACQERFVVRLPEEAGPASVPEKVSPGETTVPPVSVPSPAPILPGEIQIELKDSPLRRGRKKRSGNRRWAGIVLGGVAAVGLMLIVVFVVYRPSILVGHIERPIPPQGGNRTEAAGPTANASEPGESDPIDLRHLPGGIRLLVHLRPGELWRRGSREGELLEVSGSSGEWFARMIRSETFAELSEIDELLLGWILGGPEQAPEFVCRVRRRGELTNEVLIERLGEEFQPGSGGAWRESASRAFVWIDDQTYVVVPKVLSEEVKQAAATPLPTDLGIEELLQRSSRADQFTMTGIPHDLATHRGVLCDPCFQNGWQVLIEFLEQEHQHADAFQLSGRWGPKETSLTLRVKGSNAARMNQVRGVLEMRMAEWPGAAQRGVTTARLPEGFTGVLRRFPAMLRTIQESSGFEIAGRTVLIQSRLPERALPNLLLGGILAWQNLSAGSLRSSSPEETVSAETDSPQPPGTEKLSIPELLQKRIDVEFQREPLEGVLQFVAREIGCAIEIDGDALKLAGYTRNMPQTLRLENYPAGGVLQKVLAQYDQMVLSIVEGEPGSLLVTTSTAATERKLKTLQLEIRESKPEGAKPEGAKPESSEPKP